MLVLFALLLTAQAGRAADSHQRSLPIGTSANRIGYADATAAQEEVPAPEGWAALKRGEAAKAAGIFREALDRSPYNAHLHYGAGCAALALGRLDAAISSFRKALEHEPRFPQAAVMLGRAAYARGDLDLAIRSLERARGLAPADEQIAALIERWRKESTLHAGLEEKTSARFQVLFEGAAHQGLGDRVSRVLENAYVTVGKTLNSYPSETITVVLYTDKQFEDVTRAPAWAGGGYDGRIRLAVGGALKSPRSLDRVVVHEFVHAAIATIAPRNVPAWVNEGLASLLDSPDRAWPIQVLAGAPIRIRLDDLEGGFGRFDGQTAAVAYAESAIAARLLVERLGPNVNVFLQMLGSGHTVDQALSTLDVRPEAFREEWRRRAGVKE